MVEYHQHEVIMFFGLYTSLRSQQAGTGHGIVGHRRAGWRCNTGVCTRGLGDTMGWRIDFTVTIIAIQWSISVSRVTIWPCPHGQCRYK